MVSADSLDEPGAGSLILKVVIVGAAAIATVGLAYYALSSSAGDETE